jgi:uncharacterized protein YjbI with pentapeptide repeats
MADPEQLDVLKQGVSAWNAWREARKYETPSFDSITGRSYQVDLVGADLQGADLEGGNFRRADLAFANLSKANLDDVNFSGVRLSNANLGEAFLTSANFSMWTNLYKANLRGAQLRGASFRQAFLREADLRGANLEGASLLMANLTGAKLSGANLKLAHLVQANLTDADLTGCHIYGTSVWSVKLSEGTKQQNLVITTQGESEITVDNIEVAQFIYLLLRNEKIRGVIDTITSKAVLILGRFSPERKQVLDALREELRRRSYLPILFDFEGLNSRTTDETITLLARMARFVIADISDARSVLQELRAVVPELPSVPVQPVIVANQEEPGMFDFYQRFAWFLPVHRYETLAQLLTDLSDRVIGPAEEKVRAITAVAPRVNPSTTP